MGGVMEQSTSVVERGGVIGAREEVLAEEQSDARIERMQRVAVLYGEITAATREFLAALAHSDRHRDWEGEGFRSCAEWLAWQIGVTRGTANEKVRTARALEGLPLISRAMAKGEVSFSKVRALTRAATADNERELLEFARASSAAKLERLVRGWKKLSRWDEAQEERARHRRRCFSVFPDEDGMYVVRGRLSPEVGAALMRAIEAASNALFAEAWAEGEATEPDQSPTPVRGDAREAAQRRADAVRLLAERALAAGFRDSAPISGSRAERYQVMLHVDATSLTEHGEPGRSELEDGTRVSAETARRLSCDASLVRVRHGVRPDARPDTQAAAHHLQTASVLDVGRKSRTVSPALRRALEVRDRGCRFPGCGLRFTDAHHIVHWGDGGDTKLHNCLLLCRSHHRWVHEGGYRVCSDRDGQVVFFTPMGKALFEVPPLPELPADPVEALVRGNHGRGVMPDAYALANRWRWDRDVPWAIEAATEDALDSADEPPGPGSVRLGTRSKLADRPACGPAVFREGGTSLTGLRAC
jgi:hypothetical protein